MISSQDNSVGREGEILNEGNLGNLGSCAGSSPASDNILEPYEKRHYRACRDELDAADALIYFTKLKDSQGFACVKNGFRVTIVKVGEEND